MGVQSRELEIMFDDCSLSMVSSTADDLKNVQLRSLTFSHVDFTKCPDSEGECSGLFKVLKVSAAENISFSDCALDFDEYTEGQDGKYAIDIADAQVIEFKRCTLKIVKQRTIKSNSGSFRFIESHLQQIELDAIDIVANKVIFEGCVFDYLYGNGLIVTANEVSFISSWLNEPQKKALFGLVGTSGSSVLVLNNVTFDNPSRGALITRFPTGMVYYKELHICIAFSAVS